MTKRQQPRNITCPECGTTFLRNYGGRKYCSTRCREAFHYNKPYRNDYSKVHNNWEKCIKRLIQREDRNQLSVQDVFNLLERQEYRCALSGEQLTCNYVKGEFSPTNLSIDRIVPGGNYVFENVRLVCRIINIMRWSQKDADLIYWCRKIIEHSGQT